MGRFEEELEFAIELADRTWQRIRHFYGASLVVRNKIDGPVTEADCLANTIILEGLAERFPQDGALSEEAPDDARRLDRERVWVIDPIDGTRDFIEHTGHFVIQIGFVVREGAHWLPKVGVVYEPVADVLYFARHEAGAWARRADGSVERMKVSQIAEPGEMTLVMTRSHKTGRFLELVDRLAPYKRISMGSIGLKMMRVARGEADYYLNNARGFCNEWDIAAPEIILKEAGGAFTDLRGERFTYNQQQLRVGHGLLASNNVSHPLLLERISEEERAGRNAQNSA